MANKGPAVVVRNTFLEVAEHTPLQDRCDSFRRQQSEPVKLYSSQRLNDQDDSDDDFPADSLSSNCSKLRADALPYQGATSAVATACSPQADSAEVDFSTGYAQPHTGNELLALALLAQNSERGQKGQGQRNARKPEVRGGAREVRPSPQEMQREPQRLRDGQLSRLKDDAITRLEPPWKDVTTVMMRNLPNKYTQQMLIVELRDAGFHMQADFDFFYLPMDHSNCANLGYCFINFTETCRANDFAAAFSGKRMRRFNSHKTAVIMPASIQGYDQNYTYYVSTRVAQASDPQYRPLFLRPLASWDGAPQPLPEAQWPSCSSGSKGDRDRDQTKGGDRDDGKSDRVQTRSERRGGQDWDTSNVSKAGNAWENVLEHAAGTEWKGQLPGQQLVQQIPQDYQVMCAACGTLCGASYRFCSFCGNFLCESAVPAGHMMMPTYFQSPDFFGSMATEQMELTHTPMGTYPNEQKKSLRRKAQDKATGNVDKANSKAVAEELDILHGRMMLLAALKVAGTQEDPLAMSDEDA
ncbi:unnamed protein product [Polarella glacialis]|uniref:Mei2-like C-terminal RNA recognition motif domain-containing protein n=1 Tax=Polarella glacialis TaxID=89957 RepID=A0A813FGY5_POLGL|nr:unnamed protein product [Polarella glacialis]